MGQLYQNFCYDTITQAREAACSGFDAKEMAATELYTSECISAATANTMSIAKRKNGVTFSTVSHPYPVFRACDELSPFPAEMSLAGGGQIAGAVLAVWAVGYGFRALIRTLNLDSKSSTFESES
jgi:hypothetical protein